MQEGERVFSEKNKKVQDFQSTCRIDIVVTLLRSSALFCVYVESNLEVFNLSDLLRLY